MRPWLGTKGARARQPLRIGELIRILAPKGLMLEWPPDVFAVCGLMLQKSGAYTDAVDAWPPKRYAFPRNAWQKQMERVGTMWRRSAGRGRQPPSEILKWWGAIQRRRGTRLSMVRHRPELLETILKLFAAADEASAGVGIPPIEIPKDDASSFEWTADAHLDAHSTLCQSIDPTRARVLPKLHTPTCGLTIRSFSHHLALYTPSDVSVDWRILPLEPREAGLNMLIVPWPWVIASRQFERVSHRMKNLAKSFGVFRVANGDVPSKTTRTVSILTKIYKAAARHNRVDVVVLPEAALTESEYRRLRTALLKLGTMLVISGVFQQRSDSADSNSVGVSGGVPGLGSFPPAFQGKHHRWRFDGSQIHQYGLQRRLDPQRAWWEGISLGQRRLTFFAIYPWLTMCVLICEDLARQEPAAEILRAIGPNLVIALLLDGPQLRWRWSSQYAGVLADDPGSSVLTLTSLGMVDRYIPREGRRRRVVALWKDHIHGPMEIELKGKERAVLLQIGAEPREEWTADGRRDGGKTWYPVLRGGRFVPGRRAIASTSPSQPAAGLR